MSLAKTQIAVSGISESEVRAGLGDLLDEFHVRSWIVSPTARWDASGERLIVTIHYEGIDAEAASGAAADEVWDCVFACLNFASEEIEFEVIESSIVQDA